MNIKNVEKKYNLRWNENCRPGNYALVIACLFSGLTIEAQTADTVKTESHSLLQDEFPPIRESLQQSANHNFQRSYI